MSKKVAKNPVNNSANPMTLEEEVIFERVRLADMESVGGRARGIGAEFKSDESKKYYYVFLGLIAIALLIHFS